MKDNVKVSVGFGLAGLVGGALSSGGTFLGLGLFGALCGIVLGLLARNRRVALVAAVIGAVAFMAGGALAFLIGMAAGFALGAPDWYDVVLPAFMGACAGIVGGLGLVGANHSAGHKWRSAVGLAVGFAVAALINQIWLLDALPGHTAQATVPLSLWGVLGGVGFSLLNRSSE